MYTHGFVLHLYGFGRESEDKDYIHVSEINRYILMNVPFGITLTIDWRSPSFPCEFCSWLQVPTNEAYTLLIETMYMYFTSCDTTLIQY